MPRSSAPDEHARLEHRLARALARAVEGFAMIADGDRVMVAVSGGKDSYTLHHLLHSLGRRAPVRFSLVAVHLDQGQPSHDPGPLERYLRERGHEVHVVRDDTYSIVVDRIPAGKTYCSLCSRLRRAVLYRVAGELGCNKIALGHHRDDCVATLMLNLVFGGQLKAMPPKLVSDDGRHVVIRPLVYCAEQEIARFAAAVGFPLLPCNLCGSQPDQKRRAVGELLADLDERWPGARDRMLAALANVRPSHLLDPALWSKLGLEVAREQDDLDGGGAPPLGAEELVRP
jgi:tRNA 2-thiocytidine biosynthesis protein TtcA